MPFAEQVKRILRPYVTAWRDVTAIRNLPYVGNGMNYEAAEVVRCLKRGELESPIMPLDETYRITTVMDEIRAQWLKSGNGHAPT